MRKLAVIIVNYNVKYYVEQCLLSVIKAAEGIDTEIFVVDNDSQDDSVVFLSQRFPNVNIIKSTSNLGFARANNIAIRQSDSEYVLLLNPDTIVAEDTLRNSIDFLDSHEKAGAVGVRMLQGNGISAKESRRGLPTPLVAFYKMCGLCERFPNNEHFGHYYMGSLSWDEPGQIEVISGAYFMARRKALDEIGLLDEDFFMYGEDIDLSYRMLKGGYENWYLPETILHYKGESTQKSSFRYVHVFYEAMLIFFRKHYSHSSWLLTLPIKLAIYTKAFGALVSMQMEKIRHSLGFIDRKNSSAMHYLFIVGQQSKAECERIAKTHALDAEFVEATSESLPNGHLGVKHVSKCPLSVVYDVETYSYTQIFDIFRNHPDKDVLIGTYNPATKTVITPQEVLV